MPQYELGLRDYWQIISKRRQAMAFVFIFVVISTVVYTNLQQPLYQAVATVKWQRNKPLTQMLTDMVTVNPGDPLVSQEKIIRSNPVLAKAALELGFIDKNSSPKERDNSVKFLKGAVATEIIPKTNIIRIRVIHPDPKITADIANKVAEAYVWYNLKDKTREVRQVKEFVEARMKELEAKLKKSEKALADFKKNEVPSGIAIPLQKGLLKLEMKKSQLLLQYTESHPDIKEINEQISLIKEQLKKLPEKELKYSRLTRDTELYDAFYKEARKKLELAKFAVVEKIPEASLVDSAGIPRRPSSPNKKLNYLIGIVIGLMLGTAVTFVVEQLDTSIGTIEDIENIVKLPALGVIPYLKTKGEEASFLRRLLPKRRIRRKDSPLHARKQLIIYHSASSTIFEAYRILKTNIQNEIFKDKKHGKVILFSSAGPEEGKSINIANVAVAMAQDALKTLLIDADMRRPTLHKIFGLGKKEPGLGDILRGTAKPREVTRNFADLLLGDLGVEETLKLPGLDHLDILTAGLSTTSSGELLGSPELVSLLEELREKFDIILVDSPPVMAVADTVTLSSKVDGVVLLYRVGKTARSVLVRTKRQLIDAGGRVIGVILNNISPEMEVRYGHYYRYKYYGKYYSDHR